MAEAQHNPVLRYLRRVTGAAGSGDVTDADLLARFLKERDEASFELLLWRHGTMVLHVCRDVTRDEHAAEDAFQATFLTLVRKAASIRSRESLGAWLYQVAYRAALRARRGKCETVNLDLVATPAVAELPDEAALRELRPLLHEEVERLPAKYRTPIVLCYLEGLTHEEAARQLGRPKGTVAGRMARARELLRRRLARRGIGLAVALSALALAPISTAATVPAALVQITLRAAVLTVARKAAGAVSAHVLALSEGVIQAMYWHKVKLAAATMLALGLLGGVGLFAGGRLTGQFSGSAAAAQDDDDDLKPTRKAGATGAQDTRADRKAHQQSLDNLKEIALAMHNYYDIYGFLPPAAIYGKNGKPLLSWRVLLLPFFNQNHLYKQFHLDEAWDSAHNKKLLAQMPAVYRIPGQKEKNSTLYQVFVGPSTIFERPGRAGGGGSMAPSSGGGAGTGNPAAGGSTPATGDGGGAGGSAGGAGLSSTPATSGAGSGDLTTGDDEPDEGGAPGAAAAGSGTGAQRRGSPLNRGLRMADIVDGTSNTLLVVEGGSAVPWTKPEDLPFSPKGKLPALGGAFEDVIHAAFADGHVCTLKRNFDPTAMRAAITRNGGEVFDLNSLIDPAPGLDAKALKEQNQRLQAEVEEARAEVAELSRRLEKAKDAARRQAEEDLVAERLKKEHQQLRQQLDQLRDQSEKLRQELERLRGGRNSPPAQKQH
jgi:RNA polymerase sigma factor (sigma-70 family)